MPRFSKFVQASLEKLRNHLDSKVQYKVEKKHWGAAVQVQYSEDHQTSFAIMDAGGHSSIHYHKKKVNSFYCVEGEARILVWWDQAEKVKFWHPSDDQIRLCPGGVSTVKPPVVHQMFAVEDTVLIENYFPEQLGSKVCLKDIYRLTKGGVS